MIHHFGNDPDLGFRTEEERENSPINVHREDAQDIATVQRAAAEQVQVSGAKVNVYVRTDNGDYDEVWDEDADPTYWPGVPLRCYFKPQPSELELKRWGVDAVNKAEAVFAISHLTQHWPGRMLRSGDVLELPYNHPVANLDPGFYRVVNATPSGNYKYTWLYYTCTIETLSADETVRVADDLPPVTPPELESGGKHDGGL